MLEAGSLYRFARATLVALLVGTIAATGVVAPVVAAKPVPRVVLVVGPVGGLTDYYRGLANDAAAVARAAGAQVVKVYSPNATWPAVREALKGASIVVYLGHGNGWPSRYRDSLYPPTQNGFGLNPVAGVDDSAHQYFGEAFVDDVRLAKNAVVLLHHLCYASGNTEPGLPEGSVQDSIQRVDNFAAGFIRAGARAVVAEGHLGPAYYVRSLLRSQHSIESIWRRSPNANGNTIRVASSRSPGFTARLDPDRPSGGFYRSLVSRGVTAGQVRSGATGRGGSRANNVPPEPSVPLEPSLVGRGVTFGETALASPPVAAGSSALLLPIMGRGAREIPERAQVGVRWDPIVLDPPQATIVAGTSVTANPSASPGPASVFDPAASPAPSPLPAAPQVDLVAPEHLGDVVNVGPAKRTREGLAIEVTYPSAPGMYRLVTTLHTPSGTAYDASTQELLTAVIVHVGGPVAVAYGAPATLSAPAGSRVSLPVRVVNSGSEAWDAESAEQPDLDGDALLIWLASSRIPARLFGTWVSTGDAGSDLPEPLYTVLDLSVSAPGGSGEVLLAAVAPAEPGEYLLLLDVVSPDRGPLSAFGNEPAIVRATITAPDPTPSPEPLPTPIIPVSSRLGD